MARLIHLNGNLLCSVDTETTGLTAGHNDLIQIAIIPLDSNLEPLQSVIPFIQDLQPKYPDHADPEALRVNGRKLEDLVLNGMEPFKAADLLEEWFNKLNLPHGKKIAPLGQNYQFDQGFIREWLGDATYNHIFDYHYRDTMSTALFINDRAAFHGEPAPFPKVNLKYLASQLNISTNRSHDAVADAMTTAKVYKTMMNITMSL